ncbi:MAG: DMT family transporter [Bauldia sp.]
MAPHPSAQPFVGIALKVASTVLFTAMSTLIKLVSDRFPVGEITFFRCFVGLLPVALWVGWRQIPRTLRTPRFGGHVVRSVAGSISMFCGFSALGFLPIADATAIGYAQPLLTVIFAVVLLHERVHAYRWSAVAVGLCGVFVILSDYVGPDATETSHASAVGAMFAVAGALSGALAATQTRSLTRIEPAATIVAYFLGLTALASLATAPFGWAMPNAPDLLALIGAGPLRRRGASLPHPELPFRRRLADRPVRLHLDALGADRQPRHLRHLAKRHHPRRRGDRHRRRPLRHLARKPPRPRTNPSPPSPNPHHDKLRSSRDGASPNASYPRATPRERPNPATAK